LKQIDTMCARLKTQNAERNNINFHKRKPDGSKLPYTYLHKKKPTKDYSYTSFGKSWLTTRTKR